MLSLPILTSFLLWDHCQSVRLNGTFTIRKMEYQWIDSPDTHHDCSSFIECLARCSVLSSSGNVCNVAHYDNGTGTCTTVKIVKLEGSGGQIVRVGLTIAIKQFLWICSCHLIHFFQTYTLQQSFIHQELFHSYLILGWVGLGNEAITSSSDSC